MVTFTKLKDKIMDEREQKINTEEKLLEAEFDAFILESGGWYSGKPQENKLFRQWMFRKMAEMQLKLGRVRE